MARQVDRSVAGGVSGVGVEIHISLRHGNVRAAGPEQSRVGTYPCSSAVGGPLPLPAQTVALRNGRRLHVHSVLPATLQRLLISGFYIHRATFFFPVFQARLH